MFLDWLILHIKAGNGGAGSISFRREKSIAKGGPNGGNGGNGGSVLLRANCDLNTLNSFRHCRNFCAGAGNAGMKNLCHGKDGANLVLDVPVGTVVYDANSGDFLYDLTKNNQIICVAKGGLGGYGNYHYRSSVNRVPRFAQSGQKGESIDIKLELKLIADVGLLGFPNAGKSTLVSKVSSARPKIASYPFTTLEPQLGVVIVDELNSFIISDIPGLVNGAASGVGLGIQFLRHIERTQMLLHLIDLSDITHTVDGSIEIINSELRSFSSSLLSKPRWLVGTKIDVLQDMSKREEFEKICYSYGQEPLYISSITGEGIRALVFKIIKYLNSRKH